MGFKPVLSLFLQFLFQLYILHPYPCKFQDPVDGKEYTVLSERLGDEVGNPFFIASADVS